MMAATARDDSVCPNTALRVDKPCMERPEMEFKEASVKKKLAEAMKEAVDMVVYKADIWGVLAMGKFVAPDV